MLELTDNWWAQAALDLSAEQREQMLAHRYIKLASLARLVQERRDLQARLQVGRTPRGCMSEPPCSGVACLTKHFREPPWLYASLLSRRRGCLDNPKP